MRLEMLRFGVPVLLLAAVTCSAQPAASSHETLLQLFEDWRAFEAPPWTDGAPDYTARCFAERYETFRGLRTRLEAIDASGWPIPQQVDWHLVRAEMNGFDFNHRVLSTKIPISTVEVVSNEFHHCTKKFHPAIRHVPDNPQIQENRTILPTT